MESIIFKIFGVLFRFIGFLLITGTLVAALTDIQKNAFDRRRVGLVSMLRVNQQLVGRTR